jgi:mannosyltransferase OCH1-like enzyme
MPADYRRYGEEWARLNPGFEVWDWSEEDLHTQTWTNQAVVDHLYERDDGRRTIELWAQLADVVDYELLYQFGGVYVNADVEPIRPLTHLGVDAPWVASEDDSFVVNCAMAGAPLDGFYADVIDTLRLSYWENPTGPMNRTTGPWLLTQVWRRHPEVTALAVDVFNPVHWKHVKKGATAKLMNVPESTVALHHWGHRRDGRTNTI